MNYYEILKISKNATSSEIKSAYKDLVKKYHPDIYLDDKEFAEQMIKKINEAYDVLSDSKKKKEYDDYLNTPTPIYNEQTYTSQTSSNENTSFSADNFITNKINQLSDKQQLKFFIFILVFFLAIVLLNFIKIKSYLANGDYPFYYFFNQNTKDSSEDENDEDYEENYYKFYDEDYQEPYDDNNKDSNDEFYYFDIDKFYNILEQYTNEIYKEYNNSSQNSI